MIQVTSTHFLEIYMHYEVIKKSRILKIHYSHIVTHITSIYFIIGDTHKIYTQQIVNFKHERAYC